MTTFPLPPSFPGEHRTPSEDGKQRPRGTGPAQSPRAPPHGRPGKAQTQVSASGSGGPFPGRATLIRSLKFCASSREEDRGSKSCQLLSVPVQDLCPLGMASVSLSSFLHCPATDPARPQPLLQTPLIEAGKLFQVERGFSSQQTRELPCACQGRSMSMAAFNSRTRNLKARTLGVRGHGPE